MDTRNKILTLDAARKLATRPAVVTGRFDVLRAETVRALARFKNEAGGGPLLAVALPVADAVLNDRARAELAAALRIIDYVVIANQAEAQALISALQPAHTARLEELDARLARELREHVRRPQA